MAKFLDNTGLAHLWEKIATTFATKNEVAGTKYVKCDASFITTEGTTYSISIPSPGYDPDLDVIAVDTEGLTMIEGVDYSVNDSVLTLTVPITHVGTTVHFHIEKRESGE